MSIVKYEDLRQYDHVVLKDGREGAAVELYGPGCIMVDVGSSPTDWDNIDVTIDDIVGHWHQG